MQALYLWGEDNHEKGGGLDQKNSFLAISRPPSVTDWNLAAPTSSSLLKKAHIEAGLKFASEHLNDSEDIWEKVLWSDEAEIKLFAITLTLCI